MNIDTAKLMHFPTGYRNLAYLQETTMGVKVARDLPGHRRESGAEGGSRACGEAHDKLYWQCKQWIDGDEVDI